MCYSTLAECISMYELSVIFFISSHIHTYKKILPHVYFSYSPTLWLNARSPSCFYVFLFKPTYLFHLSFNKSHNIIKDITFKNKYKCKKLLLLMGKKSRRKKRRLLSQGSRPFNLEPLACADYHIGLCQGRVDLYFPQPRADGLVRPIGVDKLP